MRRRRTPQIGAILRVLTGAEGHITAEEIFEEVRKEIPGVSLSTIYRGLERLRRRGLVAEADFGDHRVVYHPIEKGHHHHLVCRVCGRVFDIGEEDLDALRESLRREYDFVPEIKHMAIFGYCEDCEREHEHNHVSTVRLNSF